MMLFCRFIFTDKIAAFGHVDLIQGHFLLGAIGQGAVKIEGGIFYHGKLRGSPYRIGHQVH